MSYLKYIINYELIKENPKYIFKKLPSYSRNFFFLFRMSVNCFVKQLTEACIYRKKRRKSPRKNSCATYLSWKLALQKEEIGRNENSRPHCKFSITTLEFTKAITPGNTKSEIWDDAFEVS